MRNWFVGFSVSIATVLIGGALVASLVYITIRILAWIFHLIGPTTIQLVMQVSPIVWFVLIVLSIIGFICREAFSEIGEDIRSKYA
jgi:hypothetical protein